MKVNKSILYIVYINTCLQMRFFSRYRMVKNMFYATVKKVLYEQTFFPHISQVKKKYS